MFSYLNDGSNVINDIVDGMIYNFTLCVDFKI